MSDPDPKHVVEAILLNAAAPVSEDQLGEAVSGSGEAITDVLSRLAGDYVGRGIHLHGSPRGWMLRTSIEVSDLARQLVPPPPRLTRAAMETLVAIAAFQPVTRSEIERIRAVQLSPGILDALLQADLVRPGRRRDGPGRPLTWSTTENFLDHFGIESLDELAACDRARAAGYLTLPPARADLTSTSEAEP